MFGRRFALAVLGLLAAPGAGLAQQDVGRVCSEAITPASADRVIAACGHYLAQGAKLPAAGRASAHNNIALALQKKGDLAKALAAFDRALAANRQDAAILANRCMLLLDRSDNDRAIADCTAAIRLQPNLALAYDQRGLAHYRKNAYDLAVADFRQALKLDPSAQASRFNLANVEQKLAPAARDADRRIIELFDCKSSNLDSSFAACSTIVARGNAESPDRLIVAYLNRGLMHKLRGQWEKAAADFREVLRLEPRHSLAMSNLAQAERSLADLVRALPPVAPPAPPNLALKPGASPGLPAPAGSTAPSPVGIAAPKATPVAPDSAPVPLGAAIPPPPAPPPAPLGLAALAPPAPATPAMPAEKAAPLGVAPRPDAIAWSFLKDSGSVAGFRRFLAEFPNSLHRRDAEARIAELEAKARDDEAKRLAALQPALAPPVAPAPADPGEAFIPADERRVALVIGNGAYRHVARLPNPRNDSTDVAASLERLGFSVKILPDASHEEMRRALRDFGREAQAADLAVVFYAGHGMEIGGENYLVPVDAELKRDIDVEQEAVTLKGVMLSVSGARKLGLVVLDACRDNPFLASMKRSVLTRSVPRGLAKVEPAGSVLVAFASKEGTTADDGRGRNSPFTAALLAHLEAPGLEVNFLFRNVRDDVIEATNRVQEPFVYGSLSRRQIFFKPRRGS